MRREKERERERVLRNEAAQEESNRERVTKSKDEGK